MGRLIELGFHCGMGGSQQPLFHSLMNKEKGFFDAHNIIWKRMCRTQSELKLKERHRLANKNKSMGLGLGEVVQSVKCLPSKQEELSAIPKTHLKC